MVAEVADTAPKNSTLDPQPSTNGIDFAMPPAHITEAGSADADVHAETCAPCAEDNNADRSDIMAPGSPTAADSAIETLSSKSNDTFLNHPQTRNVSDIVPSVKREADCYNTGLEDIDEQNSSMVKHASSSPSPVFVDPLVDTPCWNSRAAAHTIAGTPELTDSSLMLDLTGNQICMRPNTTHTFPSSTNIPLLDQPESSSLSKAPISLRADIDTAKVDSHRDASPSYSVSSTASSMSTLTASSSSSPASNEERMLMSTSSMDAEQGKNSLFHSEAAICSLPRRPVPKPILSDYYASNAPKPSPETSRQRSEMLRSPHSLSVSWQPSQRLDSKGTNAIDTNFMDCGPSAPEFTAGVQQCGMSAPHSRHIEASTSAEQFGSNNPYLADHESSQSLVKADKIVPISVANLSQDTSTISSSLRQSQDFRVVPVPQATHLLIFLQNNKRAVEQAAVAETAVDQGRVTQVQTGEMCAATSSQCERSGRNLNLYRPDLHTIAALVVEERNINENGAGRAGRDGCDVTAESVGIDNSFIPKAVQQHASSQKKRNEADVRRQSKSPKQGKKLKKKTGRMNKERLCAEKVLLPTTENLTHNDSINRHVLPTVKETRADAKIIGKICTREPQAEDIRRDMTEKKPLKKKKGKHRRQVARGAHLEQEVVSKSKSIHNEQQPRKKSVNTAYPAFVPEAATTKAGEQSAIMGSKEVAVLSKSFSQVVVTTIVSPKGQLDDSDGTDTAQETYGVLVNVAQPLNSAVDTLPQAADKGDLVVALATFNHETKATDDYAGSTIDEPDGNQASLKEESMVTSQAQGVKSSDIVEPRSQVPCNDSEDKLCGTEVLSIAPELVAESPSSSDTASTNVPPHFDVESHVHTLLTRSMQQQQQQQYQQQENHHSVHERAKQGPIHHHFVAPPLAYNDGPWAPYNPYLFPEHWPMYPAGGATGLYPFSDQLPEYFPPHCDYPPYAWFPQPQYYESCCDQGYYDFEGQLPPGFEPHVAAAAAASYCGPRPEELKPAPEVWKNTSCGGESSGYVDPPSTRKTWYLQPLVYEEEKERAFEARGPSNRMRLMKVCRKYGL